MNVRDLTVNLRPRTPWEAVDLGTELGRHYYRDLYRIGLGGFGPFFLLLAVLSYPVPYLLPLFIWWLKPLMDRFYLFYLSRRIFGQEVTIGQTWGEYRRLLFGGSFSLLTWRRFLPSRSMTLAVSDLENLKNPERSQRCAIVTRVGGSHAFLVTLGGVLLEILGLLSVFILGQFFIPQGQGLSSENGLVWLERGGAGPSLLVLALGLSYGFLVILLEPFYLASGFALYLNSRTSQEAWDIELRFRELATRVKSQETRGAEEHFSRSKVKSPISSLLFVLAGGLFFLSGLATPLSANEDDPPQVAREVLAHEDFVIHYETEGKWVPSEDGWWQRFLDWLEDLDFGVSGDLGGAGFANGLFFLVKILALVLLVVALVVLAVPLVRALGKREKDPRSTRFRRPPPTVVMGMEVTPESLPDDLLGEARQHWQAGDHRRALSLLYRGALTHFIAKQAVAIESSHTENECLTEIVAVASPALGSYFGALSQQWMKEAYSRETVRAEDFEKLCQTWPFERREA